MAKKKTEPKEEPAVFDWQSALMEMEVPDMLKAGFKYYIINNNIELKSENDLTKTLSKFKEMSAGV